MTRRLSTETFDNNMDFAAILGYMNHASKAIILGYSLSVNQGRSASAMHEDLHELLYSSRVPWIPKPPTVFEYLGKFEEAGIAVGDDTKGDVRRLMEEQKFFLIDERFGVAAKYLMGWAVKNNTSLFGIFSHTRNQDSRIRSTLAIRLALLESLYPDKSKTLTEIVDTDLFIDGNGINESVAYNNLQQLGEAGLVRVPATKVFSGNIFKVVHDLEQYFIDRLPSTAREVFQFFRDGKSFKSRDIVSSLESSDNLIGMDQISRYLRRMERKAIISSEGGGGRYKTYTANIPESDDALIDSEKAFLKSLIDEFLGAADRKIYSLYEGGAFDVGIEFKHSHLYPYFSQREKTARDLVSRLEKQTYVEKVVDCKADKHYALTDTARRFYGNCLVPIADLFKTRNPYLGLVSTEGISLIDITEDSGHVTTPDEIWINFLTKVMTIYEPVSPYLKRRSLKQRKREIMDIAIGHGDEIKRQELLGMFDVTIRRPLGVLLSERMLSSRRVGATTLYEPTETGIQTYQNPEKNL